MELKRLQKLKDLLPTLDIKALLVTNFVHVRYLTGFLGLSSEERESYLLITYDKAYFFTDGRYELTAKDLFNGTDIVVCLVSPLKRLSDWLKEISASTNIAEIYFEKNDLKYSEFEAINSKVALKPAQPLVEELRTLKDEEELGYIQQACKLTDDSLNDVIKLVKLGITEQDIAWKLEQWVKEKGHELAFDPIVAFGSNSALPHYHTKLHSTSLEKNTLILIDYGVKYRGYCADITRMFFYGKPDVEVLDIYDKLLKAQMGAIQLVSQSKKTSEIDKYVRESLHELGLPPMPHSTGHGVGLQIHEGPSVSQNSKNMIQAGQVFTIEPGVYFPDKWGMRIEDTVYINGRSQAVPLTQFPKALQLLD